MELQRWAPERRIRFERELRGWTTEDVAHRLVRLAAYLAQPDPEIEPEMVAAWEAGERISPSRLVLLSVVLELPIEHLMPLLDTAALAPWVTLLQPAAGTMADDVLRRDLLSLGMMLGAIAVVDPERLRSMLGQGTRVDRELIEQLQRTVRLYARQYDQMPPSLLRRRSHWLLQVVKAMLAGPLPPGIRRELLAVGAEVAVLAGWSSRTDGRVEQAHATYSLADTLARAADSNYLRAFIKARTADLHSMVQAGGAPIPDSDRVCPLMDGAENLADPTAPVALRAHVLLRQAEEHAAAGDGDEASAYLERADNALNVATGTGDGLYGIPWHGGIHAAYRGNVAILSGRPNDAVRILEDTIASMPADTISNRSSALADMAAAHALLGNLDSACELLAESFQIAYGAGLHHRIERARGVRLRYLDRWSGSPELRRLDEQLAG